MLTGRDGTDIMEEKRGGESMEHREYVRVVAGADTAVLMIHGIVGTPAHFRDLVPLVPENWTLVNLLLDGHGGSVGDFSRASMHRWKAQVNGWVQSLTASHRRVILVAHSMGTLFAIRAAVERPEEIAALFLLAVPLRPWVRLRTAAASLRLALGLPGHKISREMAADTSVALTWKLWQYLGWIPRYVELLAEIGQVRRLLPRLTVPTEAFQSRVDELVSARSIRDLEGHPHIALTVLEESGHFAYGTEDRKLLQQRFREIISKNLRDGSVS